MNQYQETFKRYEKKYLLNDSKYEILRLRLQEYLQEDDYGQTTICNIYFDTPDHRLVRNSLEKPIYKEKLRLRSYGTPRDKDTVFIELKKKYKGVVYKRRVKSELSMAEHYLYDSEPVTVPSQITREIDWFLSFYQEVKPAMYISYNRIALYGIQDESLRVTFDSNIIWREEELWLEEGVWGNKLLEGGGYLMEIKIPGAIPLWLSHILNELEIYPCSFSKYGRGYQESVQLKKNERRKGEILYA
ncbi:MAG: polyphosphate polymerase domain-containing protein [Anaerocolumna sp.]